MTEQSNPITPARVPVERIDDLMASLKVTCLRYPGTTTTVAIAVLPGVGHLPGFTVAEGHAFCADPSEFDARRGVKTATDSVLEKARATLWCLEAYVAWCQTQDEGRDAGLRYSVAPARPPYQQKVIDAKADMDQEIIELEKFIQSMNTDDLPAAEWARIQKQLAVMRQLAEILAERIAAFPK